MDAPALPETGAASPDAGLAVAAARKGRRLTQRELARQAAVSLSLLRKIEQGERPLTPGVRAALTRVLGPLPAAPDGTPPPVRISAAIPLLQDVMDCYDLPSDLTAAPRPLPELSRAVTIATHWRLGSRYAELAEALPGLITELTTVALASAAGHQQEQAYGLLALAYRAADAIADKHGHRDMSERDIPRLAMYGALNMRAAVLAARAGIPAEAADRMAEARAAAGHVPDGIYYGTAFGPSSARVHELATAVEAGDTSRGLHLASRWRPPGTLPAERRSHFHIEAARAYHWAGNPDQAINSLWQARQAAPQHTRCNPQAIRTVQALIQARRRPSPPLLQLAAWLGLA